MILHTLLDRGLVPDWAIRRGIRRLLRARLDQEDRGSDAANEEQIQRYMDELRRSPLAVHMDDANDQHYEVPAAFFEKVLGKHLKYSCGLWSDGVTTLDDSEEAMLALYAERAGIEDGMEILDLGCGWGSFSLYAAERFPNSRILGVSNSAGQRAFIEGRAAERGLDNLEIVTRDINDFETTRRFDRVVSIEMFEHLRNYEQIMRQVAGWLKPDGQFFAHIFVHERFAYPFETDGAANWLGRHFFTGGQMPSADLLPRFDEDMTLQTRWDVDGTHYARTSRAWLDNVDRHKDELIRLLDESGGPVPGAVALRRWRVFFMACEELWAYDQGREWFVSHYLFRPKA
ncbi:MAG: cyclopropane-fatty-acyl-phospholipid synthase family protein, partial [Planctomycetota bacterium]|nr:cyclopropane-fatty-acyl-phospholipid synthase family protein [Planctomycetota bacterium]